MNKVLRTMLVAAMTLVASASWADNVVTFTAGKDVGGFSVTKDGVTIALTRGPEATGTGILDRKDNYRIYQHNILVVSTTTGSIKKIVLTCTANGSAQYGPGSISSATPGKYTAGTNNIGTWEGNAPTVSLASDIHQTRCTKIEVTVGEATSTELTIDGTTPFDLSTTVSIVPSKGGDKVYYTVDGTDPQTSTSRTLYAAPFSLSETTTVKAAEYDASNELVATAEKTFTKNEVAVAADFAAFKALADNTVATLKLTDAQITYVWKSKNNNTSIYARDASGALLLFHNGAIDDVIANMVINGSLLLQKKTHNGIVEAGLTDNTTYTDLRVTQGSAAAPKAITTAQAKDNVSDLVVLTDVRIAQSGDNFYAYQGNDSVQVYNGFHLNNVTVAPATKATVTGIITLYDNKPELYLTKAPEVSAAEMTITGTTPFDGSTTVTITPSNTDNPVWYTTDGTDPATSKNTRTLYKAPFTLTATATVKAVELDAITEETVVSTAEKTFTKNAPKEAADFAAFKALTDKTIANLKLTNAQITYVWKSDNGNTSIYARDASGALLVYDKGSQIEKAVGMAPVANLVLDGSVELQKTTYNGTVQAAPTTGTKFDGVSVKTGDGVQPKAVEINELKDNVSDLVELNDVDIKEVEGKFYAQKGMYHVQLFDHFHKGFKFEAKQHGVVKGIVANYKGTYEIYPIESPVTTAINEVNADKVAANGKAYNLSGQRVGNDYKGIVIVNGKKMIRK